MDAIEIIDLCRQASYDAIGVPKDAWVPRTFSEGDYQNLWRAHPKQVRKLLDELLCGPRPGEGLELLLRFNVLSALFPEVVSMKNLGDGEGMHKDVWEHTKSVVSGVPATVELRWAALLHDVGKARTRRVVNNKVTFHNHDIVGARMVDALHSRTNLFQDDTGLLRTVRLLVQHHLRPAGYKASWTDSAVRRLVTECGDPRFFDKLMSLSRADLTTKHASKRDRAMARGRELEQRVAQIIKNDNAPKLPKGTMGIIMSKVAARPGPWLNAVREQLEAMMVAGLLQASQPVDYYVSHGVKIIEEFSDRGD